MLLTHVGSVVKHDRQCTNNVMLWHVCVIIFVIETKQYILCVVVVFVVVAVVVVVESHGIANCIKILSVAQQCFSGKIVCCNNARYTYRFLTDIFKLVCTLFTRYIQTLN